MPQLSRRTLLGLAAAALPVIIDQLTNTGVLAAETRIDFVHPAARENKHCIDANIAAPTP